MKKRYQKLDKAIMRRWVEDLRANPDKQGMGVLKSVASTGEDFYCCLGRLCELEAPHGFAVDKDGDWAFLIEGKYSRTTLPSPLRKRIGMTVKVCEEFIAMNDQGGLTFAEIADWIEENILKEDNGQDDSSPVDRGSEGEPGQTDTECSL